MFIPGLFLHAYFTQFGHNYHVDLYCPAHISRKCNKNAHFVHQCCDDILKKINTDPIIYLLNGYAHLAIWTSLLFIWEYRIHCKVYSCVGGYVLQGSAMKKREFSTSGRESILCVL
ncbi:hypothetical protein ElyMa_007033900 [Elysia marginata]|uniref:Uncharacterized protein n=1 Tax=Elysia marginata TaxID=1093978 RepID=A0AAV4JVG4_9GAST|nr:hypothetical protein ElyMa_007033900 [Elysia marginata]